MQDVRDNRIDWIRAICSLTIILAHVGAPHLINQIRSFDVIALVFLSGISMTLGSKKNYSEYISKRIKKLLLPTLFMMVLIFSLSFIACIILHIPQLYSGSQIIRSFFLLSNGSMGYVWIVRVYLLIALCEPLIKRIVKFAVDWKHMLCVLGFGLLAAGLLYMIGQKIEMKEILETIYFDYVYSTSIYCFIALLGVWFAVRKQERKVFTIGCIVVYLVVQCIFSLSVGGFAPGDYKFPPRIYYCVFGLAVTVLLYQIAPKAECGIVKWISRNSFSIYLWHIVMLRIYGLAGKLVYFLEGRWGLEYITVTVGAMVLTWLSQIMLTTFEKKVRKSL